MMKLMNMALVAVILGFALHVYVLEMHSRTAGKRLIELNETITEEQEAIRRLRAEWSYLNTPARLERLALKYLDHQQSRLSQVLRKHEIGELVPSLRPDKEKGLRDPIADMLAGNAAAVGERPTPAGAEQDLIGNILKGLN